MTTAHQKNKVNILITDVGSSLGIELAKNALLQNQAVYGIGSTHLPGQILSSRDFTLLEIDLSQPLPAYLPDFDIIYDLSLLQNPESQEIPHLSPQITNTLSLADRSQAQVAVFAPIGVSPEFYDYLTSRHHHLKEKIRLFLVGDLFGPNMNFHDQNRLAPLISQAATTDRIILQNEGLEHIYPAYIPDIILIIDKITESQSPKKVHYLVTESAMTALSVAYEIQNATRLIAGKEIGLFFAGLEPKPYNEPEVVVKTHDLGITQKHTFSEGLKKIFESLKEKELIADSTPSKFAFGKTHQPPSPQVWQKEPETDSRLPRIPRFDAHLSFKKIFLIILSVFVLVLAKTGFDIFFGLKNLRQAQDSLFAGDFSKAQSRTKNAQKSFIAAQNKVNILTYPFSLITQEKVQTLQNVFESSVVAATALTYFIDGSRALAHNFAIIASPDVKNEGFDLETPAANFQKSYELSARASHLLENSNLALFKPKVTAAKKDLNRLHAISLRAYELTNLTDEIIGPSAQKTYLVLLQNNTELRPGGGFIGNFAQISFESGRLREVTVEDIYTIDGQLKEKIEPPLPLKDKLGIGELYLRDSNWSGDFEVNAATARDLFKKETGRDVAGVIALDLTLVAEILKKMGPVTITDYNQEITAENLFERGEYYSEVGFFPGSTQKRDFFGALTRTIVTKILESLKSPSTDPAKTDQPSTNLPWLALTEDSAAGLPQKHLMLTFDDPTLSAFIKTKGWNQPLPPLYFNPADDAHETRDYVAIVEANVGANKVNRFLEREIFYEMTIGRDADLVAKLKINYTNKSLAETWPAGKYVNFLRVYVPFAASLFEYQNGDLKNLEEVELTSQGNLTVFSTYVEVPIKSQKEVIFTYRLPKNIKLEDAPTYSIYFQKQAGTLSDPLEFKFNLPAYVEVNSVSPYLCDSQPSNRETETNCPIFEGQQNITIETDLSTDRHFTIDLEKN